MVAITLSEIQRDFPAYLRRVAEGEVIIVTDHDRPVAEIAPPSFGDRGKQYISPLDYLKSRINDAQIPDRWRDEGVAEPTEDCRRVCIELTNGLFNNYGLLPAKVVASRQEGIYLSYKVPFQGRTLGIEVDNELDAVAVVSDANGTLASAPFESEDADRLLHIFFEGLATSPGHPQSPNS
jgi:prevent-host-death family protein